MPRDQVSPNDELVLDVLEYWHKIEFFIPYDLKSQIDQANAQDTPARRLDINHGATALEDLRKTELTPDKSIGGYRLFIGVFDKSEVTSLCKELVPAESNEVHQTDDQERAEIEGATCFAKIKLSSEGEPSFEDIEVSTLPWALGKTRKYGLDFLSTANFESDWRSLETQIYNFRCKRDEAFRKRQDKDENLKTNSLQFFEIVELSKILTDWADFTPLAENDLAFIEMWIKEKRPQKEKTGTESPSSTNNENDEEDDDDEQADQSTEIGILNSFFIRDIERSSSDVRHKPDEETNLHKYITSDVSDNRTNLFEADGQKAIIKHLSPTMNVDGRWFDEPHHMMSLMQQFSINAAFVDLQESGIFSVNGPPGTGKTTLLREMFAENIVRRANVLANLKHADDAFERDPIRTSNSQYYKLKQDLTGFEMVVVSTNNAAVENISRELPQSGSLGKFWNEGKAPEYLKPIAYNVAAKINDHKFRQLPDKEIPWGLVSCVLGKAKNRSSFQETFLFSAQDVYPKFKPQTKAQGLWDWLKTYAGASFSEARSQFHQKKDNVRALKEDLSCYENLIERFGVTSLETFVSAAQEKCESAEKTYHVRIQEKTALEESIKPLTSTLQTLKEQERLLDRAAPAWWEKLFATSAARRHKIDVRHNANEQRPLSAKIAAINQELSAIIAPAIAKAKDDFEHARHELETRRYEWEQAQEQLEQFKSKYPDITVPQACSEIEQESFQIGGLWHTEELAKARSELFQAALSLHEAWLAEVGRKDDRGSGPFRSNIFLVSQMLKQPRSITNREDVLALWQSLFMMVPVVSTTFASFGNQFSFLGRNSLGWVFIDEAGQAPPQASVGAFWRGKRVIAVGGPRQIEPVFTVPTTLIEALSKQSHHTEGGVFAPNQTSVQELSDKGNRFGAYVDNGMGNEIWIGSPLRVHRRCINPMFSIANRIAYEDSMVFGLKSHRKEQNISIAQDSCWINVKGSVRGKQTVDAQVSFVTKMIESISINGDLPQDVFVITPFKEIRQNLVKELNEKIRKPRRLKKSQFDKWCKTSVGTVHTFQGKEAAIVMFVLGADHEHDGSAKWAASKPNLLNVALTRAKQRIFIVGDPDLWGQQKYFSTALKALPKVGESEFMERLNVQEEQL